jgi:TetR/AcrR family transcriptional regulator, ethionamide resistance regulator
MIEAMSTPAAEDERARPERGRRNVRPNGDERERSIMSTAEQLLQSVPLSQISVDAIAQGAGISRSAFYNYFPSKDACVLSLIDRMAEQAEQARDHALRESAGEGPASWRASIAIFYEIFGAHRAIIQAAAELSATNKDARDAHSHLVDGWIDNVTGRIQAERARGKAPDNADARALATALVQLNQGALKALFTREGASVSDSGAVDLLTHIWLGAIYTPAGAWSGDGPQGSGIRQ